jgi:arylsulfatase A-like enzyme
MPHALVANVDVAPTLLDIAGGTPKPSFNGRSLVGLALGADHTPCFCKRAVLLENREFVRYRGVRMRRWKYVRWPSGHEELYDLRDDPYELINLAGKRSYRDRIFALRVALERLARS